MDYGKKWMRGTKKRRSIGLGLIEIFWDKKL